MWECSKCHTKNEDGAGYCYGCKTATRPEEGGMDIAQTVQTEKDMLMVLSFFIPIVGVILYLMYMNSSKKVAEAYLTWSVMSVCIVAYVAVVACTWVVFGMIPAAAVLVGLAIIIGSTVSAIGGSKVAKYVLFAFILATYGVIMYYTWISYGTYAGVAFGIGVGVLVECILMALLGGERVLYILSFFVPPVGFLLYAVKRDSAPVVAKNCLVWMFVALSLAVQVVALVGAFMLLR